MPGGSDHEHLRERPAPKVPTPGEADYCSADVSFPTDLFTMEVLVPTALQSSHHGLQVILRDNEFPSEDAYIRRHGLFQADLVTHDGEAAWRLRLQRESPPIRTTYRLHWTPPRSAPPPARPDDRRRDGRRR